MDYGKKILVQKETLWMGLDTLCLARVVGIKFDHEWLKNLILCFIETGVLIAICYKKGEFPKWQWGGK